jgi:hypothetical protein
MKYYSEAPSPDVKGKQGFAKRPEGIVWTFTDRCQACGREQLFEAIRGFEARP